MRSSKLTSCHSSRLLSLSGSTLTTQCLAVLLMLSCVLPPMHWPLEDTFPQVSERSSQRSHRCFDDGDSPSICLSLAGYQYVQLDCGYQAQQRTSSGSLTYEPTRFPNGIKTVSDYVKSKGFKWGMVSRRGSSTHSKLR